MPVGKKLAVVLSVLAAGAGTALFFRKDPAQVRRHEAEATFGEPIERRIAIDPSGPATPRTHQVLRAPTAAIPEARSQGTEHAPQFRQSFSPVGSLLEPIEGGAPPEDSDAVDPLGGPMDAAADGLLRHKVADGDTLTRLAATYLDRSDRYLEIFELNRDVLTSPDLLPIGRVIRIPPRQSRGPSLGVPPVHVPPRATQLDRPLEMVPVPRPPEGR